MGIVGWSGAGGFQHLDRAGVDAEAEERGRTATMCGGRKSGGKPPRSIGGDGLELSNDRVAETLTRVKSYFCVIRMSVAI